MDETGLGSSPCHPLIHATILLVLLHNCSEQN